MLARASTLPVVAAKDGMPVRSGRVVVAVPDFHLVLSDGTVRVARGAKENRNRPSIDVLFRSAAATFGPRAIGIVLSGMLDDGAAGLWSIKRQGGIAIVQDPSEADYAAMPQNAMDTTDVDFSLPAAQIGKKLVALTAETVSGEKDAPQAMSDEVRMATENDSNIDQLDRLGERTPFTCPECGGVLWELSDTGKPRFRCHVGHAYSMATFEAEQGVRVEAALWAALRVLEENQRLARRLADAAAERGNRRSQTYHEETAQSSEQHAGALREILDNELPAEPAGEERRPRTRKRN